MFKLPQIRISANNFRTEKKSVFVLALIFLLIFQQSTAQTLIKIEQNFDKIAIGKNLLILEDKSKNITFEQAQSDLFANRYKKSEKDIPFFGYQNKAYWIKFTVENVSEQSVSAYLLIDFPILYQISFYQIKKDTTEIQQSGGGFNFSERKIKTQTNVFELNLPADSAKTYYCRIESDGGIVTLPVSIISKNTFVEKSSTDRTTVGIFYGILILIILVNFFYYVNLRDDIYILYVLYVILIGLYQFTREGLAFQYLWGNAPVFNNAIRATLSLLSMVAYLNFVRKMLNTKSNFPIFNKIIVFLSIIIPIMLIPIFIPAYYRFLLVAGNYFVAGSVLLAFVIIILSLKRKMFFAGYFLVAIFFLISGATMLILKNNGVGGIFQWEHSLKIGSALEVVLLTYGLTVKFKKELSESQRESIDRYIQINKLREDENEKLEKLVNERTNELIQKADDLEKSNIALLDKNEEINQQKEELLAQRNEIESQKEILVSQKKQLTDSIQYAKRIQNAALVPDFEVLKNTEFEYFTFYQARDIVSGDFYRIYSNEEFNIFVAADCTGHGVPGGYLSMLGIAILNEIMSKNEIKNPAKALNILRDNIKSILHQNDENAESRDGMDIAICFVDKKTMLMQYAGAHLPVYLFRNENGTSQLTELRGDKMPIGFLRREKPFTNHEIQLLPGDKLYLFSDGFVDQYGGEISTKFKTVRFKNMLEEISHLPWNQQKSIIEEIFNHWKTGHDQVDDVLVMGINIK